VKISARVAMDEHAIPGPLLSPWRALVSYTQLQEDTGLVSPSESNVPLASVGRPWKKPSPGALQDRTTSPVSMVETIKCQAVFVTGGRLNPADQLPNARIHFRASVGILHIQVRHAIVLMLSERKSWRKHSRDRGCRTSPRGDRVIAKGHEKFYLLRAKDV
jgi:hypothetical protein